METLKKTLRHRLLFLVLPLLLVGGAGIFRPKETDSPTPSSPPIMEQVAKAGVETILSFLLETRVSVESVRLDPANQQMELVGFTVLNPKGFDETQSVFAAQRVLVQADPLVLFSPRAVVRHIELEGANVFAEARLGRGFNLKKLLDSVNRFKAPRPANEKRWILERGVLNNFSIRFNSDFPPKRFDYAGESLEMSMRGPHDEGVTADKIIAEFLSMLINECEKGTQNRLGQTLSEILNMGRRAQ